MLLPLHSKEYLFYKFWAKAHLYFASFAPALRLEQIIKHYWALALKQIANELL